MSVARSEKLLFRGQEAFRLTLASGANALVMSHGAQVLSWQPAAGEERLYLSEKALFEPGRSIRGGVPIVFPQFSNLGDLPQHGLLHLRPWSLIEEKLEAGAAMLVFRVESDAVMRKEWPHSFAAEFTVLLSDKRLDLELEVENSGAEALSFTAALHTYFAVADIEDVHLAGLHGVDYRDVAHGNTVKTETGDVVVTRGEVDRVYHDARDALMLREPHRALAIHSENFVDTVLWNPGPELCRNIADLADDDYRRFLCVAAGVVRTPIVLATGESWWGRQTLVDLSNAVDEGDDGSED